MVPAAGAGRKGPGVGSRPPQRCRPPGDFRGLSLLQGRPGPREAWRQHSWGGSGGPDHLRSGPVGRCIHLSEAWALGVLPSSPAPPSLPGG